MKGLVETGTELELVEVEFDVELEYIVELYETEPEAIEEDVEEVLLVEVEDELPASNMKEKKSKPGSFSQITNDQYLLVAVKKIIALLVWHFDLHHELLTYRSFSTQKSK